MSSLEMVNGVLKVFLQQQVSSLILQYCSALSVCLIIMLLHEMNYLDYYYIHLNMITFAIITFLFLL